MDTAPETTDNTTEESGLPLGLPDDVYNQVPYIPDCEALLRAWRVDRSWAKTPRAARPPGAARPGPKTQIAGAQVATWCGGRGPQASSLWSCATGIASASRGRQLRPACRFRRLSRRIERNDSNIFGSRRRRRGARERRGGRRGGGRGRAVAAVGLGPIEGLSLCVVSPHLASRIVYTRLPKCS